MKAHHCSAACKFCRIPLCEPLLMASKCNDSMQVSGLPSLHLCLARPASCGLSHDMHTVNHVKYIKVPLSLLLFEAPNKAQILQKGLIMTPPPLSLSKTMIALVAWPIPFRCSLRFVQPFCECSIDLAWHDSEPLLLSSASQTSLTLRNCSMHDRLKP